MLECTASYPYKMNLEFLEIDHSKADSDDLWEAFISGFLKRRHDIAHGVELENTVGHSTIESDKMKIKILLYAFTAFICVESNPIDKK